MTELTFKGKEFVYNHHLSVPFRPLVPHADKGIGGVDLGGNLIIQGDNLHALKALLPQYAGKVDCIFIDPPYNTGNEGWAYNDNVNAPMIKEWLAANPIGIEDGLRHDKWCAMMWPRLRLLHELLAEGGSLWVTLDDNEVHSGRMILEEIFGSSNFISQLVWQKKYSTKADAEYFSPEHDYILVFCKNTNFFDLRGLERTEAQDAIYRNFDNDARGPWTSDNLLRTEARDYAIFPITGPNGDEFFPPQGSSWRYNRDKIEQLRNENRLWFGQDGKGRPRLKRFLSQVRQEIVPQTIWKYNDVGHSDSAKKALNAIMADEAGFATPKPVPLVARILDLATHKDALILDSFAGSGTTAHAVLEANRKDGGNRKFILVEMEDYADKLTAERVRRVINGYGFAGTQNTELARENLNWKALQKADDVVQRVHAIENLHGHEYDKITKQIRDATLIVTGEKAVAQRTDGLGGSFTYCTLGDPVELDAILTGQALPAFETLGGVLYHMAINHTLDATSIKPDDFYLGEHGNRHVWLIYKPDLEWLKGPDAALNLSFAHKIAATFPGKDHLVFAPSRFVSGKLLSEQGLRVEFVPLPFALYRIEQG